MATTDITETKHIKVGIRPAHDDSELSKLPSLGFWGQLLRGNFLVNIDFHAIEDAFVELIRNRLINNGLNIKSTSTEETEPSLGSVDTIVLCHKLEALLATKISKSEEEKILYDSAKPETVAEIARLKYELSKAQAKLCNQNQAKN